MDPAYLAALALRRVCDLAWVAFDTEATGYSNVSGRLVEVAGVRFRFVVPPVVEPEDAVPAAAPPLAAEPVVPPIALPGDPSVVPPIAVPTSPTLGAGLAQLGPIVAPPHQVEILGEFSELANPGLPIPPEVVQIHGISDLMVQHLPEPVAVIERFLHFVGDAVVLAHYVPFDLGAMAFALVRAGRPVPHLAALDTSLLPKRLFPGAPNYALGTLVQFLGLPPAAAHRALPDALSTMELFRRCVTALGPIDQVTVGDVTRLAGPLLTLDQFAEIPYELPIELGSIEEAITCRQDLTLTYRGGSKGQSARRVTPSHLFARDGALFLEAYCHLDQAPKSFRVNRIENATILPLEPGAAWMRNRGSGHWVKENHPPSS
jgi:DNA polymerase III epsilon subunit-like protein